MVTLNKPSAGDTDWTAEINDDSATIESLVTNIQVFGSSSTWTKPTNAIQGKPVLIGGGGGGGSGREGASGSSRYGGGGGGGGSVKGANAVCVVITYF